MKTAKLHRYKQTPDHIRKAKQTTHWSK